MKISHGTRIKEIDDVNGYGYATVNMLNSLSRLGYEVNRNDPHADVEIQFDQPQHIKWTNRDMYRIAYVPWESTKLPDSARFNSDDGKTWLEIMNDADEVWTPSPIIADWFTRWAGVTAPVYVYEHGVDPIWTPVKREVDGTFKFFHVGAEALRKGANETMKALRYAFPREYDVELNLKIISPGWQIGQLPRINIHNGKMPLEDLIQMFHDNHVFVYPSYGEGFGLTPLQAMATGMPTITCPAWAPYTGFLDTRLTVDSDFCKTPWPMMHPGSMLKPRMDDLVDAMRYAYENYYELQEDAHARVDQIMAYYDWDRLTKAAFEDLEKRLK